MYDSQSNTSICETQPASKPHKGLSLSAHFSQWYPKSDIYSTSLRRTFAAFKREQRLAAAIARLAV